MRFTRIVFLVAGIYGILVIAPMYFLEARINRDQPPPITHPEYFYGFVGVTLAWQILFLILSTDPLGYRAMMPAAILEKMTWGIALILLLIQHRLPLSVFYFGMGDWIFAVLFLASYIATGRETGNRSS